MGWQLRPAKPPASVQPPARGDAYAGWKQVCDAQSAACFLRPPDWQAAPYGGFQDQAATAYANISDNTKDRGEDSAYIAGIYYPQKAGQGVAIVGFIHGTVPGYALYDEAIAKGLQPGTWSQLVVANPVFAARGGLDVTFSATPGSAGIAAITTFGQAQNWFASAEAKTDLKIMQSFHYRE
ncbi:MAG TPA: hypothetical protein VLF71_00830 [Candidatus Saccharimonadales bacterium]|nr:hypothetical protein [Candidatus Saccharimonadales bacterium]